MEKAIPILILLISATTGVLSQGLLGGSTNVSVSISPFNPIGFANFILYMVSLPFRIIGAIFGFDSGSMGMRSSDGSEVSDSNGGIFDIIFALPAAIIQEVARFVEEIFHFVRLLLDTIFGNLEGGAALIAGDDATSQRNRSVRNGDSSTEAS